MTHGFNPLANTTQASALTAIRAFKDISNDNDPHNEHDFGSFSSTMKQSSGKLRITTIA